PEYRAVVFGAERLEDRVRPEIPRRDRARGDTRGQGADHARAAGGCRRLHGDASRKRGFGIGFLGIPHDRPDLDSLGRSGRRGHRRSGAGPRAGHDALRPAMTEPVIRAEGLTKKYARFTAVEQLDLSIEAGEVFGILGPNG